MMDIRKAVTGRVVSYISRSQRVAVTMTSAPTSDSLIRSFSGFHFLDSLDCFN